ncbi:MAG: DUF5682 family protein [Actinomyces bowdenii]|nr:DUF5682 family protein [Actinomyces bowdenii]
MRSPTPSAPVPARLQRALDSLSAWSERGVHLAAIRHHSPACALALQSLLEEVRPTTVLIEGPSEYTALLPALQDEQTRPPVAVLSLGAATGPAVGPTAPGPAGAPAGGALAAYYPLAEFSPEWVALRWAGRHGARAAFIDRSAQALLEGAAGGAGDRAGRAAARTLQAEHHLAHSAAMEALARRLGCRDHDELWEHLFENRSTGDLRSWSPFFAQTLAWAATARLDARREDLEGDGTLEREAVMSRALDEHLPACAVSPARTAGATGGDGGGGAGPGPLVVVTGAFHALALLEALDGAAPAEAPGEAAVPGRVAPAQREAGPCWLIRYDYARLDALRGYGAGMPSPSLWQRAWRVRQADGRSGPRALATGVALEVIEALREAGEPVGTAQAQEAAAHALGLAELRGHAWPGRSDLLDALSSCLVKGEGGLNGPLGRAVARVFADPQLGRIPTGTTSPPLLEEVRARARALRLVISDSAERRTVLDTARRPAHRARREFLARTRFAGIGFARQVGGADIVAGTGMGRLTEEWAYAWTPQVETALIRASGTAPSLEALIASRIAERLQAGPTVPELVELLTQMVVMGMGGQAAALCARLESVLARAGLDELVGALHGVLTLTEGTGRLDTGALEPWLRSALGEGVRTAARLLAGLAAIPETAEDTARDAVETLIALRDLLTRLGAQDQAPQEREAVARQVEALSRSRWAPPMVVGSCTGIAALAGRLDQEEVAAAVAAHLGAGADPQRSAGFLIGLVRTSPDLVLHAPGTLEAMTRAIVAMSQDAFLTVLPDLRRAFTALRPRETHRLAAQVARLTGARTSDIDAVRMVSPELASRGLLLERDLVAGLERDALSQWVGLGGTTAVGSAGASEAAGAGHHRPHWQSRAAPGPEPDSSADPGSADEGAEPVLDAAVATRRWRLILGRYAEPRLARHTQDQGLDETLGHLYDREYRSRGHQLCPAPGSARQEGSTRPGGLGPSVLQTVTWLATARELFPASALERMEADALTRYGLTDLLADPAVVESIEADPDLAAALLRHRGTMPPQLSEGIRALVAKVVRDVVARLRPQLTTALSAPRQNHRRSPHACARDLDWRGTIRANLGHVDPATARMIVQDMRFVARQQRRNLTWDIIILVDQSGSMADSLIHTAVTASILAGLPGLSLRLLAFDTAVVDLTDMACDPVEVLMTCQLGGGTDIAGAMAFAAQQVRWPTRTLIALVSDFGEGGSLSALLETVHTLAGGGVRMLGLAALNEHGRACFDREIAEDLAGAGMSVAAMTPDRFAEYLAQVMS